ncbi:uncharacterized oxidoreductase YjmC-like [Odontomachus brunneus]|uniref:uncharacterized oxidoreductase YjmC-like n=1 Tax=Odontomachus brunneus TaxID=486640 RepID=UPI0013F24037|nr:uncharacterized oxidoreductase YjmC-like [Odontomachus brunneus]
MLLVVHKASLSRLHELFVRSTSRTRTAAVRMASVACYDRKVAPKHEVVRFIEECMCKVGATPEDAHVVAHHLMTADYRGHFSHGMNRMQMYVNEIESRTSDPAARPRVVTDFQAIALVDGQNALGQVIGKYCMEMAIEKAKKFGIGMVAARGSNHYGICGYYSMMAMEQGLIGFSCTNTSPLMAPTRSMKAGLGTNPLSLGMAACEGDEFVLDMATTAVALGKIELAIRKNEDIPEGWALDSQGKVTRNAQEAYDAGLIMPVGGTEQTSGYKGYGLGLMVEILCGVLSGSQFGPNIRTWKSGDRVADLGQCFMAINPEAFAQGSKERLSTLLGQLRGLPTSGQEPVLIAGDPEKRHMEKVDREGGIAYHPNQLQASEEFAKHMGVQPMKLVSKSA